MVAAIILAGLGVDAAASGCNEVVAASFRFRPNQACWKYEGKATVFRGDLASGRTVRVAIEGLVSDPGTSSRWQKRVAFATGPGGFSALSEGEGSQLLFETKVAGTYEVTSLPCADWGRQGRVSICVS